MDNPETHDTLETKHKLKRPKTTTHKTKKMSNMGPTKNNSCLIIGLSSIMTIDLKSFKPSIR
jgi:hypothetical protein